MIKPGKRLRELIEQPGITLIPGAYDALSARIIVSHGFEAVGTGGYAATGTLLGEPDVGQMTMHDYVDHYGRVAQSVDVPVFADADTGFGGPNNVRRCVRAFERAGVAGMFIEDQQSPKRCGYLPGKTLIPVEQMLAKIAAALDARTDESFFFVARTDAAAIYGLDAAIERAQRYMAAGADMVLLQGADTPEDFTRVVREVPGPRFANLSNARGKAATTIAQLEALGAKVVTFPSLALYAAATAVDRTMAALAKTRSIVGIVEDMMSVEDYNRIVGLDAHNEREQRYDETAAAQAKDLVHAGNA
jgi:2-methylisocitrate lyase-like PEP mutase family enzyme